jgi:sugar phosphate isomerase/epimerase
MKYGFCTDFSTPLKDAIDWPQLKRIKEAGFDFAEIPLMLIESLSPEQTDELVFRIQDVGLRNDCVCNFFPEKIRLTGPNVDRQAVHDYLDMAMEKAARLDVKHIVFGSCPARNLPDGWSQEDGYKQIVELLHEEIIPMCVIFDKHIVMEPIRKQSANFIRTLEEGMVVVDHIKSPFVSLLAYCMHINYNDEDPNEINKYFSHIDHVHIAERDRILPEDGYSDTLNKCIQNLVKNGYDKTISFESKDGTGLESMEKALKLLKSQFEK